jgi:hypothetical protein
MKLIDILSLVTEETTVKVFEDGEEIAEYNGKDAIPADLNGRPVRNVYAGYYFLGIEI